ncbi:YbhB/YbcL family Raf kinase inhibitor-like protein [Sorangium sp. So ce388]|uniref:YbhB/YbcL family Raf kinase inhibitor-like protein n=1 Tax=Sorangium sp. So ce388 TaxID=3133309 RepID=UPI003F5B3735
MHTITHRLIRSIRVLALLGVPLAALNCSGDDSDSSGSGGGAATSSGTQTTTTSSSGTGSASSTGDATSSSTATTGSGGAGGSTGDAGSGGAGGSTGDAGSGGAPSGEFTLTSPNHAEGAEFADKYTCALAGFNGSVLPELRWTAGPPGTKSYAITFIDTTLTTKTPPNMNGYHWVIYNIPADVTSLPEAFKDAASIGAQQNSNFLGPCPNFGGGNANTDNYEFTIYALSGESLTITPTTGTAAVKDAETKLEADNLAKAKLTGKSDAAPPR